MIESAPVKESYLKDWLIFTGVTMVGSALAGLLAGALAGAITGVALAISGHKDLIVQEAGKAGQIAGFLASLPVSYFVYRWTVRRIVSRLIDKKV